MLSASGHSGLEPWAGQAAYPRQAGWHPAPAVRGQLSESMRRWLLDRASLTRRIQQSCTACFRVRVLHQGWGRPTRDEAQALALEHRRHALLREVLLLCGEERWVYARSVIPQDTLSGRHRRLASLGERPLGAALFADAAVARGAVEITRLVPGHWLFQRATAALEVRPQVLWGRRSMFFASGKPLLVSEFFLPAIEQAHAGEGSL